MPRRIRRRKARYKLLELPGRQSSGSSGLNPEQLLERREKAFQLRVVEGLTYDEIGKRLGTSRDVANKDCAYISEMKHKGMMEKDSLVLLENNAHYDKILETWLPLLQPLARGELLVGETKVRRNGQDYDILVPTFESAKVATEMILKAAAQRERLNGYSGSGDVKKTPTDVIEDAGRLIFEIMRGATTTRKPIQAEVVEIEHHE